MENPQFYGKFWLCSTRKVPNLYLDFMDLVLAENLNFVEFFTLFSKKSPEFEPRFYVTRLRENLDFMELLLVENPDFMENFVSV